MKRDRRLQMFTGIGAFCVLAAVAVMLYHAKVAHDREYVPRQTVIVPTDPRWKVQRVTSLTYSPDGATLAETDLDTGLHLWNAQTMQPLASLPHFGSTDDCVTAWSADGQTLVNGAGGNVRRLNVATGTSDEAFSVGLKNSRDGFFSTDAVSPKAGLNAVGGVYGSVYVSDIRAGQVPVPLAIAARGFRGLGVFRRRNPSGRSRLAGQPHICSRDRWKSAF